MLSIPYGDHAKHTFSKLLYEGDCLDMFKQIPDNSIHIIVTSPPYNLQMEYEQKLTKEEYLIFIEQVLRECYRVLVHSGRICWNVMNQIRVGRDGELWSPSIKMSEIMEKIGFRFFDFIHWDQGYSDSATAWGSWLSPSAPFIRHQTEAILVLYKGQWKLNRKGAADLTAKEFMTWTKSELWSIQPAKASQVGHPAPFPEELAERCIRLFSYVGDVVCDPFAGSGTTLAMAEKWNRLWVGAEKNPNYISLANKNINRWRFQTRLVFEPSLS